MARYDLPDLVEVLPKLHLARVGAQLAQVRSQEHLTMQNLRAVLIGNLIQRAFIGCTSNSEGLGGNVILQELFIDNVGDGRDESLYVLRVVDKSVNVACGAIHELMLFDE